MPSPNPQPLGDLLQTLQVLGQKIRLRRKSLGVNAMTTAESAGLSRVTLHRIERGEPSVTMGAYLNVLSVLGLSLGVVLSKTLDPNASAASLGHQAQPSNATRASDLRQLATDFNVRVSEYPLLRSLAWHLSGDDAMLSAHEALGIYERNWRHADTANIAASEQQLIQALADRFSGGRLLV